MESSEIFGKIPTEEINKLCKEYVPREPGEIREVYIVNTREDFDEYFPIFITTMKASKCYAVGYNSRWDTNLDTKNQKSKAIRKKHQNALQRYKKMMTDPRSQEELDEPEEVRKIRCSKAVFGKVALISISNLYGITLQIRSCLFQKIKQLTEFTDFLQSSVIKVGFGIRKDNNKLWDDEGLNIFSFVEMRHLFVSWKEMLENYHFRRLGTFSVASYLFDREFRNNFTFCDWYAFSLDPRQCHNFAAQTQLDIDLFAQYMVRRLHPLDALAAAELKREKEAGAAVAVSSSSSAAAEPNGTGTGGSRGNDDSGGGSDTNNASYGTEYGTTTTDNSCSPEYGTDNNNYGTAESGTGKSDSVADAEPEPQSNSPDEQQQQQQLKDDKDECSPTELPRFDDFNWLSDHFQTIDKLVTSVEEKEFNKYEYNFANAPQIRKKYEVGEQQKLGRNFVYGSLMFPSADPLKPSHSYPNSGQSSISFAEWVKRAYNFQPCFAINFDIVDDMWVRQCLKIVGVDTDNVAHYFIIKLEEIVEVTENSVTVDQNDLNALKWCRRHHKKPYEVALQERMTRNKWPEPFTDADGNIIAHTRKSAAENEPVLKLAAHYSLLRSAGASCPVLRKHHNRLANKLARRAAKKKRESLAQGSVDGYCGYYEDELLRPIRCGPTLTEMETLNLSGAGLHSDDYLVYSSGSSVSSNRTPSDNDLTAEEKMKALGEKTMLSFEFTHTGEPCFGVDLPVPPDTVPLLENDTQFYYPQSRLKSKDWDRFPSNLCYRNNGVIFDSVKLPFCSTGSNGIRPANLAFSNEGVTELKFKVDPSKLYKEQCYGSDWSGSSSDEGVSRKNITNKNMNTTTANNNMNNKLDDVTADNNDGTDEKPSTSAQQRDASVGFSPVTMPALLNNTRFAMGRGKLFNNLQ